MNITPPSDLSYTRFPEALVAKMIENEPALRVLLHFQNLQDYRRMTENRDGPVTRSYKQDFSWIMSMGYISKDVVPVREYEGITPVAGLDERTGRLLVHYGIGADPDVWRVSPNDIMQILRRGDRYARRDITAELLFKIILRDDFLDNPEALMNLLVYMGYQPKAALDVTTKIRGNLSSSAQLRKAAKMASTAGGFTSWINQGNTTYKYLLNLPEFVRPEINAILNEIMFSRSVCESFRRNSLTGIDVVPSRDSGAYADRTVSGPLRQDWVIWALQSPYGN
jgi:hypothetical protein